jgi:RNA polymerase sigma-70 factor (ECF subfamily)
MRLRPGSDRLNSLSLNRSAAPNVQEDVLMQERRGDGAGRLDDTAMRALAAEHGAVLRAIAVRLTGGDMGRAEDAVQEALIRAWQHPEVLDTSRGSTRGWLVTTVRRILVDAHRAREARPMVVTGTVPDMADPLPGESEVDRLLEQTVVLDALAALSPPHREAIVQCYYVGRTVADAADHLGLPPGTVKSRLFYGLRALRAALAERGVHQ